VKSICDTVKKTILFTPVLAPLLLNRSMCNTIAGVAAVHMTLVATGLPGWQCPMRYGLGIPCPGCGLSRAIKALVSGHVAEAIAIHAFAPIALGVLALILCAVLGSRSQRNRLAQRIWQIEQVGISIMLSGTFLLYWLIRLLFFREALYNLVM
jgi:Protein of unknown function (DUF2752)